MYMDPYNKQQNVLILLVWYILNLYSPKIYQNDDYAYMNYARVMFTDTL